MKPIRPAPLTWEEFWQREVKEVQSALHQELTEGAPITLLCYQPVPKERFVYLRTKSQEKSGSPKLIELLPDGAGKSYLLDATKTPWRGNHKKIEKQDVDDFFLNPEEARREIVETEKLRYESACQFDHDTLGLLNGETYLRQIVIPSPIYEKNKRWWKHWPRLGLAYSVERQIGSQAGVEPELEREFSEQILLLMAVHAGNSILAKRLRLCFNYSYYWSDENSSSEYFVELDVAKTLCMGSEKISDQSLFVICKLILAHHLFYPHRAVVLSIFELLESGLANRILNMHGWPDAPWFIKPSGGLETSLKELIADMSFLLWAIVKTNSSINLGSDFTKNEKLEKNLRKIVCMALGVLAGKIEIFDKSVILAPPSELAEIERMTIPFYTPSKLHKKAHTGDSEYFIKALSPINVGLVQPQWHKTNLTGMEFPDREPGSIPEYEWLGKYIYARYILAKDTKEELPVSNAPQTAR